MLWKKAGPIWHRTLHHPFVRGIGDGTLAVDTFKFYVRQDYIFLIEYSRVLA
ncbi:MAG: thiaminase II, partial [Candidatus Methylomirabilales bacterium]